MSEDNSNSPLFTPVNFDRTAAEDFEHAHRKAFWRSITSWFTQGSNTLIPFDEVRQRLPMRGQHYIGLRQIPTTKVIGSVGRYNDFDRAFLPRQTQTRGRWISVDRAHLQDVILPPIEVYKLGEYFFVKDGNHRVSVARERGQVFIDAYVIEIDISVPVDENTDIEEIIRKQEHAEFMEQTHLDELRPDSNVELSLGGQYTTLLEHIKVHRWFMGEKFDQEINYADAVTSWYDEVYLPLVKIIRENGILRRFSKRTETDLYLWIIEHLWYLRGDLNEDVSLETAATHFVSSFSPTPTRRLWNFIRTHFFKWIGKDRQQPKDNGDGSTA